MITDRQVRLLRQKRMEGKTQETAAAKAGMSVRSARNWQSGPLPSATKPEHRWRTRPDPFDGVWEEEIEPLLRNDPTGKLKATTIIDWLAEQHPGRFSASQLRTMQRRLQDWRALHGPEREVYFPQVHPPGREAQFDFTHCGELFVVTTEVGNLEDKLAYLNEQPELQDEHEISFRLLRHYASSVQHHKYHGIDIITVQVAPWS